jgi:hypothetical protein
MNLMQTEGITCAFCSNSFPASAERCPHCARPGLFANVVAAENEYSALCDRYEKAKTDVLTRGVDAIAADFEAAAASSKAVVARPLAEVLRLASSSEQLYATYYDLIDAGMKLPTGEKWDVLRAAADSALFPGYARHIRFAALTVDDRGLSTYGDCLLFLKDEMIAHRSSVFEANSVGWMEDKGILMSQAHRLPEGYRAAWQHREKLAIAKLANKLEPATDASSFSRLLLGTGDTTSDDDFVEVHIWGPFTIQSCDKVRCLKPREDSTEELFLQALREKMQRYGVELQS